MGILTLHVSEMDILGLMDPDNDQTPIQLRHHGLQGGSFQVSHLAEHRSTAQFTLLATEKILIPWGIPFWGRKVEAWDSDGVKIFGGTIDEVKQSMRVAGANLQTELQVECLCTDWNQVLDTLYLSGIFQDVTAGEAITALFTAEGGTYGVCPKLSGDLSEGFKLIDIQDGADISIEIVDPPRTVAGFLDRMAELSKDDAGNSYTWWVDPDKGLHFVPRSVEAAPFGISDTNGNLVISSLTLTDTRKDYANEILLRFGASTVEETVTCTGDNVSRVFPREEIDPLNPDVRTSVSLKPMRELVRVELNGVTQEIGLEPEADNPGADWYWTPGGISIRQSDAAPAAISDTDVLTIVYRALFSDIIGAVNYDEIAWYANITGSPSGKIQMLIERTELTDAGVITQTVERLRDKISQKGREIRFQTYTPGLLPGQLLTVDLAAHSLIDEEFVVDSVEIRDEDKTRLVYTVTGYGAERIRNAVDFFQALARGGTGGGNATLGVLGDSYDITVILLAPEVGDDIATHLPINTRGRAADWRLTAVVAPGGAPLRMRVKQNGADSLFDGEDAVLPAGQQKATGTNMAEGIDLVPGDYISADVISTGGAERVTLRVRVRKL